MKTATASAILFTAFLGAPALADDALPAPSMEGVSFKLNAPAVELSLQPEPEASAPDHPAQAGAETDPDAAPRKYRYGDAGSTWLTFGGGAAFSFEGSDRDYNAFAAYSIFLADSLEFSVELGGWYFDQEGPDTGGINGSMIFRWHFWMSESRDWTVYGDVGIGLLGAFDEVPDEGTSFNFTPRAGGGFTHALDDEGDRLMVGIRWHHISNGRINSDASNPSRDSIMFYAGIILPF